MSALYSVSHPNAPTGDPEKMNATRSTINTVTLTCSNCGGGQFTKISQNEYRCDHCGALTLVEDDVAQRLEQILRGMQQQPRPGAVPTPPPRKALIGLAVVFAFAITTMLVVLNLRSPGTPFSTAVPVDVSRIRLSEPQPIHTWSGDKLLVMMRNETGVTLNTPRITAAFFNGDITLESVWSDAKIDNLMNGEHTPVLLDLPNKPYTRLDLGFKEVRAADLRPMQIEARKVMLVRDGKSYRLVGLLTNREQVKAGMTRISLMLYGEDGKLIGIGDGFGSANELDPGATTMFDMSAQMHADVPLGSYEYLVDGRRPYGETNPPATNAITARLIRIDKPQVRDTGGLKLSSEELLDENFKLFDNANLSLSTPRRLMDELQRPLLLATITNNSKDQIVISPDAQPSFFDGHTALKLRQKWIMPSRLYPGERVPMQFYGDFNRYTEMKTDWAPAKQQALPGERPKLDVVVEGTESGIGTGTVNFSYRYSYKYVKVRGRVINEDTRPVDDVKLWVSLYDAAGLLTGAVYKDHMMPILKPGESAPFEAFVNQYGANYAKIETLYEAGAK